MPIVVNSNASATSASFNLSCANDRLCKSLPRLSSGNRISNPTRDSDWPGFALGSIDSGSRSNATVNSGSYIRDITDFKVSQYTDIIERIADMRADNGTEQNRLSMTMDQLRSNHSNIESVHSRIINTDTTIEFTRSTRQNDMVQASVAIIAQSNQPRNMALNYWAKIYQRPF